MRIILQVIAGPERGRKVQMQLGQSARFGRTEWADFSFASDKELADEHFLLDYSRQGLKLRALGGDRVVKLNSTPVSESTVQHGDQIEAGKTMWQVLFAGQPTPPTQAERAAAAAAAAAAAVPEPPKERTPLLLCEELELGDDEADLANSCKTDDEWIDKLAENEKYSSALRVQAFLLPAREAVWWAAVMVNQSCAGVGAKRKSVDVDAEVAGLTWAVDANEDHRRDAERAAARTKCDGPGAWVALAAFWSGDSIAPPELEAVKPDPRLTSQAVATAMVIAAYLDKPGQHKAKFAKFLATGRDIQQGKIKLPAKDAGK